MKYTLGLLICFLFLNCQSQISVTPDHHNFRTLTAGSVRYVDIILTNKTPQKIFILRIDAAKEIVSLISNKMVLPDSSAVIRLQLNPREKGRFNYQAGIFVSAMQEPIMVDLTGEVAEIPSGSALACPDFSTAPAHLTPEFILNVDVIDNITGEPIKDANLKIIRNGLIRQNLSTPSSGHISGKIPLGYYYFVTSAEGYHTAETDQYVNARNNTLIIALEPVIKNGYDPEPDDSLLYVSQLPPHPDPGKTDTVTRIVAGNTEEEEKDSDTLDLHTSGFRYNNLVFLVDISGSMLYDGKLELLKTAMVELANTLRPEDRISLVVFSGRANVVMENVKGSEKELIIERIQQLEGGGNTAGSEGLKEAYRMAEKNRIQGGNNMVIMATDGAFNIYTSDVMPTVKKYRKKGIATSVIGIKNSDMDAKTLETIAVNGGGKYLSILDYRQATIKLIAEVRRASRVY